VLLKHKLADVYAIHWRVFHQRLSAATMLHVNYPLLKFADITELLSNAALRCVHLDMTAHW